MKTYGSVQATVDAYFEGKESGKNKQGNAWFEKGVFYSYSTPIYQIKETDDSILVFINARKYSVTTAKLKSKLDSSLFYKYAKTDKQMLRLFFSTAERSWSDNSFLLKHLERACISITDENPSYFAI